jgi:hypothetical protein
MRHSFRSHITFVERIGDGLLERHRVPFAPRRREGRLAEAIQYRPRRVE